MSQGLPSGVGGLEKETSVEREVRKGRSLGLIGEGGRAETRLHQLCSSRAEDETGQLDMEEQRKGCESVVSVLHSLNEVQNNFYIFGATYSKG